MGRPNTKKPLMKGMVEVTKKNRRKLEKTYGVEIPEDVRFLMPPQALLEEDFWDLEKTCGVKRSKVVSDGVVDGID